MDRLARIVPWPKVQTLRIGALISLLLAAWEIMMQIEPEAVLLVSPLYYAAIVAAIVGFHLALFLPAFAVLAKLRPNAVGTPANSAAAALLLAGAIALAIAVYLVGYANAVLSAVLFLAFAVVVVVLARQADGSEVWRSFWAKATTFSLISAGVLLVAVWGVIYNLEPETAADSLVACFIYAAIIVAVCSPLFLFRPMATGRAIVAALIALAFLLPIQSLVPDTFGPERRIIGLADDVKVPRVILIIVDTLRADVISALNPGSSTRTPRLDEFAADAVLFENAISPAPWTFPAVHSIMTGVAPYIDRRGYTYDTAPLPTLGGYLGSAGYATRALLGNQLVYRAGTLTDGMNRITSYAASPLGYSFFRAVVKNLIPGKTRADYPRLTRRLTDRAGAWIEAHRNEPSFLWLHYMDPHDPYAPPLADIPQALEPNIWLRNSDELTRPERDLAKTLYDAEVEFVDREIGRFLDGLKEAGLYDDSLIIFTSDHGEEFLDHGGAFHASSLYQELVHVPLIVRLPQGEGSRRVSEHVPTLAIKPTILELCELDVTEDPRWPESLTSVIMDGDAARYEEPIVSAGVRRGEFQRSVVLDGMKFIHRIESDKEELYDLAQDPGEKNSILESHPEVVARAKKALGVHETESAALRAEFELDGNSAVDQNMLSRLKSLGYIQ